VGWKLGRAVGATDAVHDVPVGLMYPGRHTHWYWLTPMSGLI